MPEIQKKDEKHLEAVRIFSTGGVAAWTPHGRETLLQGRGYACHDHCCLA